MAYPPHSKSQLGLTKIILIFGMVMVAYMIYSLTVSVYQNYQIDQHIQSFEQKNEKVRQENLEKINDYKYYTSEAYIDKIAKQNLGLVNQGEEVIVLTEGNTEGAPELQETLAAQKRERSNWSNPKKWWAFILEENPYRY